MLGIVLTFVILTLANHGRERKVLKSQTKDLEVRSEINREIIWRQHTG